MGNLKDIMIILGLVIVGLACIAAVGYILFRPVGGKDPFEAMAKEPEIPEEIEEQEIPEDSAEPSEEEPAEEQEETEE